MNTHQVPHRTNATNATTKKSNVSSLSSFRFFNTLMKEGVKNSVCQLDSNLKTQEKLLLRWTGAHLQQ